MSVDYVSEKEILEQIYQKIFEDKKEQARKTKREGGPINTLFLTGISGLRKDAVQKDILEKLPRGEADKILQTYSREEIIGGVRAFYEDKAKNFHEVVEMLETLRLGEPRRISLCKLYKYLQTEVPLEDLPRIFSFDFFLAGEHVSEDSFREVAYRQIADNIQTLFLERDNEYIRTVAVFVARFLEANLFIETVYVDTLVYIAKYCDFTPDMIVRFRTLMEVISPETMRESLRKVLEASRERESMLTYVKKELEIWVKQVSAGDPELIELVRSY